ncbi:S-adenosyl-L-methionine-dependent methyltransferase [Sparassis crispa]|uniref:S-adenosyl-L-methionine-dependent methyltransferase n=1 Tax=Sparassis crispa TaxID=139825 RepID=A0A401GFT6_9APHY|nr:S-adenosyl-L-methionine-dependent methyltransferase [Sparassis crispa]GBE81029.1 S-adenosyl-L-methionine-dependent methyltransferase [Sparassis crispa]
MSATTVRAQLLAAFHRSIGIESANLELKWMREALDHPGTTASGVTLEDMLSRRVCGEPLQYVLGTQPFGPLTLLTRPPVLIPRPETEDWAIRLASLRAPTRRKPLSVLDLCTGSGCIPLLICHLWPPGSVHACGIDISEDAIKLARDNATQCDISVPEDGPVPPTDYRLWQRNTFTSLLDDIRDPAFVLSTRLHPPFDIITSNPPYISKKDYDALPSSVRDFEDSRALLGDPDVHSQEQRGLSFYHSIAGLLSDPRTLRTDGLVALEVGEGQAGEVARILEVKARMRSIDVWKDPWGKERVVVATR